MINVYSELQHGGQVWRGAGLTQLGMATIALATGRGSRFLCAVSKARLFAKYWLPVVLCAALIFGGSSDRMSFQHSSRIIAPILRWLLPQLSNRAVGEMVFLVRKSAHFLEYALLGLLLWRALRRPVKGDKRPWNWPEAIRVMLLVLLFAATDELHQRFVPSRQASVADVFLDLSGGVAALLLVWGAGRLRKRW